MHNYAECEEGCRPGTGCRCLESPHPSREDCEKVYVGGNREGHIERFLGIVVQMGEAYYSSVWLVPLSIFNQSANPWTTFPPPHPNPEFRASRVGREGTILCVLQGSVTQKNPRGGIPNVYPRLTTKDRETSEGQQTMVETEQRIATEENQYFLHASAKKRNDVAERCKG